MRRLAGREGGNAQACTNRGRGTPAVLNNPDQEILTRLDRLERAQQAIAERTGRLEKRVEPLQDLLKIVHIRGRDYHSAPLARRWRRLLHTHPTMAWVAAAAAVLVAAAVVYVVSGISLLGDREGASVGIPPPGQPAPAPTDRTSASPPPVFPSPSPSPARPPVSRTSVGIAVPLPPDAAVSAPLRGGNGPSRRDPPPRLLSTPTGTSTAGTCQGVGVTVRRLHVCRQRR